MSKKELSAEFPQLETERLILRKLTLDDREGVFRNFSDEDVTKYLMEPFTKMTQAEDIIKTFQEEYVQGAALTWAITLKDGVFIGTVSCELESGSRGEIGFDLSKTHWGKGYMTEAVGAIVAFGFKQLGLSKMKAHTLLLNSRAVHMLKKSGFRVDGVLCESSWGNGRFWDEVFFSLQRKDWIAQ